MLLAKLHQKSIRTVQMLSTLRREWKDSDCLDRFLDAPTIPSQCGYDSSKHTRIVCMSDTHGKHDDIAFLPKGDVLVHAGDLTNYGETDTVQCLSRYFERQRELFGFQSVISICGNHDITFHSDYYEKSFSRFLRPYDPDMTRQSLQHCTYLEDSPTNLLPLQAKTSKPSTVYGSPWTPNFFNWAFNLERGDALQEMWSRIPTDTDVLVTHGPPHGRGDMTLHSGHFGCRDLLDEIQQRVRPRLHIYGHIHEGYGTSSDGHTLYVNASTLDIGYEAINPCIVVDLPCDPSAPARVVQPNTLLYDVGDMVGWLRHHNYLLVAEALEKLYMEGLVSGPLPTDLNSGSTYHSLCDILGWKRRKHRPVKRELRTALSQLYADSFV